MHTVQSDSIEYRTLAFQVAPGYWCGPPRAAPPIPQAHRKIACGMWGFPPCRLGSPGSALHDGSVDPFSDRSVGVPTVPLGALRWIVHCLVA